MFTFACNSSLSSAAILRRAGRWTDRQSDRQAGSLPRERERESESESERERESQAACGAVSRQTGGASDRTGRLARRHSASCIRQSAPHGGGKGGREGGRDGGEKESRNSS